ncbi:Embryo defective [Thalictrum thalictroides]|uniref:Embryo defective n=1 Tax=Thalictrum thalictroides TaxID=46969 RepID=A0A7J6VET8_THATH|nr:Embryo defective [Thalictrum thalictroides]
MELEATEQNGDAKREREEEVNGSDVASKKQKVDEKSVEEERLDKLEKGEEKDGIEGEGGDGEEKLGPVSLGPKEFGTSVDMFNYFHKFVHYWPMNIDINKYEHLVLVDLLKKGHSEPDKKIGAGIRAFQVRTHPMWKSRCFFIVRTDESVDDFSFRKCVDCILPLPEEMKVHPSANKALGGPGGMGGGHGGRGGGGRRGGRGRGRGRGSRN